MKIAAIENKVTSSRWTPRPYHLQFYDRNCNDDNTDIRCYLENCVYLYNKNGNDDFCLDADVMGLTIF